MGSNFPSQSSILSSNDSCLHCIASFNWRTIIPLSPKFHLHFKENKNTLLYSYMCPFSSAFYFYLLVFNTKAGWFARRPLHWPCIRVPPGVLVAVSNSYKYNRVLFYFIHAKGTHFYSIAQDHVSWQRKIENKQIK